MSNGVYKIPAENFKKLDEVITKLNRKASKLGSGLITIMPIGKFEEREDNGRVNTWLEVHICGPEPRMNGWDFVAKLDHSNEVGNIVRTLPGFTVPKMYYNRDSVCDHCKVNRYRRDTFLVRNVETHEYKQVGRTCLKDFFGHGEPEKFAKMAELMGYADEAARGFEKDIGADWRWIDLNMYLTKVATEVRTVGFVSKKESNDTGKTPTCDIALMAMRGKCISTSEDRKVADDALAWAQNLSEEERAKNEYLHNIYVIAASGVIETKSIGLAASIVSSYLRSLTPKTNFTNSEFIGAIDDRITLNVLVTTSKVIETVYGYSQLVKMVANNKDLITTFASGKFAPKVGDTITITGSVKKHEIYHGIKQTVMNRVKEN